MLKCDEIYFVSDAHDSICYFDCSSPLMYRVNDMQPFQLIMIFERANYIYILISHHNFVQNVYCNYNFDTEIRMLVSMYHLV